MNRTRVFTVAISCLLNTSCRPKSYSDIEENLKNPVPLTTELPAIDSLSKRDSLLLFAEELLGTPYLSASADTTGFDCSGFVYYVFSQFDIEVPRSSAAYASFGKEIRLQEIKKGDVLLFLSPTRPVIGHVGIVIRPAGDSTEFIHATSGKAMSVVVSNLNSPYKDRFIKAVDVIGTE
jgi:cell wall-associated NlpC family hydrolase